MQEAPPPLFKQGVPARVRVTVYIALAIIILMIDSRLQLLVQIRQGVGLALYPFQQVAMLPRNIMYGMGGYFASVSSLKEEVATLRERELENAVVLQQTELLMNENAHLRQLLLLSERISADSVPAEIIYDARTPFARKVILNRGTNAGVALGLPVIDENGVVGQVTRVFLTMAEVTLLTDKDQAIPVQVARNGIRSIAYGRGQPGLLELRFIEANADVQVGDIIVTSGIDGLYPPGLAVAEVVNASDRASGAFNHIVCRPLAGLDRNRQVLVLSSGEKFDPRPEEEVNVAADKRRPMGADVAERRRAVAR